MSGIRSFGDILHELDHVDDTDVLERMKTTPALRTALELSRPNNWWGTGLNPKILIAIAKDEGIPVMWVPPSTVLIELVATADQNARRTVLVAHKQEIINQCKEIIQICDNSEITNERTLVEKAVAAYENGHVEAATALAVSIGESPAIWASTPRVKWFKSEAERQAWEKSRKISRYQWAELELKSAGTDVTMDQILIAPIKNFFVSWSPDKGQKPPESLSRHVVAHQPTLDHFSPENALLSLMLVTSILYEMHIWAEEVQSQDSL